MELKSHLAYIGLDGRWRVSCFVNALRTQRCEERLRSLELIRALQLKLI